MLTTEGEWRGGIDALIKGESGREGTARGPLTHIPMAFGLDTDLAVASMSSSSVRRGDSGGHVTSLHAYKRTSARLAGQVRWTVSSALLPARSFGGPYKGKARRSTSSM